jgi:hypothetical protein
MLSTRKCQQNLMRNEPRQIKWRLYLENENTTSLRDIDDGIVHEEIGYFFLITFSF